MNPRAMRFVGALLGAALLAACAQVPHDGPVVVDARGQHPAPTQVQYFNPKGPEAGQAPADVVVGLQGQCLPENSACLEQF